MVFSGCAILQGGRISHYHIVFALALQQCSATALPVMSSLFADLLSANCISVIQLTALFLIQLYLFSQQLDVLSIFLLQGRLLEKSASSLL